MRDEAGGGERLGRLLEPSELLRCANAAAMDEPGSTDGGGT